MDTIAMRIQRARGYNMMTQQMLADELGVTVQTVSNWEHGRRMPDANAIKSICVAMDVSADWLLGLSEVMGRG